jgi:uncharacterized protein (DUF342 family)
MGEYDVHTVAERIQVRVSDDGLEAWVSLVSGPPGSVEDLRAALAAAGVTFGVDDTAFRPLEAALASRNPDPTERQVARGVPPVPPIPPRLSLEDPEGPVPGTLRSDGTLDFRERRSIVPVKNGEPVAQVKPALPGEPGRDVRGEPLEPEAPPALAIELGDGVIWREDDTLVAARDGARAYDPRGRLDVLEVHVHSGSVDPSSGNLDTSAHLEVTRDVTPHMQVRAGASIRIGGLVDDGRVHAGLAVQIVGGVIGRDGGRVRAGTDLRARHALGAQLRAGGRIEIERSVSASRLHAREVEVRGHALSDRIAAEQRIVVQEAGSRAGGPIELHAGVPLEPEDFDPTLCRVTTPARRAGRSRSADRRARARRDRGARKSRRPGLGARNGVEERIRWRVRQRALLETATIEIRGLAHAGCRLAIGSVRLVLEADTGPCTFRLDREQRRIVADDPETST